MRFRCTQDSYTLFSGSRLLQFTGGVLTTDEAGAAAIRRHPMYGRLFTEIPDPPPASTPVTTCANCGAAFPDERSLRTHLQTSHGTPLRSERAQHAALAHTTQDPSKAAGAAGLEPWADCDQCHRQYQPRHANQRFCSSRCRAAHYRARQAGRIHEPIKRRPQALDQAHPLPTETRVSLAKDVPDMGNGAPAVPKMVRLDVRITREDSLRLHRLARTQREPLGLLVNRLIRAGLRARRGQYAADAVADLPKLPLLPPRKRHSTPSVGLVQLESAGPAESAVTIATAELVREAMNGGKKA
jgi:hypothetical protein